MRHPKKVILTGFIILGIAMAFWTGSRYPQLNEKAMMGGEMPMSGLSFDILFHPDPTDSWWETTFYNTLNWLETNKKGMTFGLLFAAGIMLLFSLLDGEKVRNKFVNAFSGLLIGTPLGVCVNCAAPIARGIYETNKKPELALSVMFSSPTTNIIVLTMMFALFPLYLALIKLLFSLFFILVLIPLLLRFVPVKPIAVDVVKIPKTPKRAVRFEPVANRLLMSDSWAASIQWTVLNYAKSLWFIVKTTVPLMLLAGILGNLVISILSPESAIGWLQQFDGLLMSLLIIGLVSLVGTFLPVPMTFDIIVVVILLNIGLPVKYAMPFLFTLGMFSIYPFLIVQKYISRRLAYALFFLVTITGGVTGVVAFLVDKEVRNGRYRAYESLLEIEEGKPAYWVLNTDSCSTGNGETFREEVKSFSPIDFRGNFSISRMNFNAQERSDENLRFEKIRGSEIGLKVPFDFSVLNLLPPASHGRSIASGDINNDVYPDLVITSAGKLEIFINRGGVAFERLCLDDLDLPETYNAGLADFDNDGWLDVFVSAYRSSNVILYNHSGNFEKTSYTEVPTPEEQILTEAPAFADMDGDGRVDVVLGNWSLGTLMAGYTLESSRNYLLMNLESGFELRMLPGMPGETLSTLVSDINNDGHSDLVVANDFAVPDIFYLGDGTGELREVLQSDSLIDISSYNTMSVSATDVNNDLIPETYLAQIDRNLDKKFVAETPIRGCSTIEDSDRREECLKLMTYQQNMIKSGRKKSLNLCPPEFYKECLAFNIIYDLHLEINNPANSSPELKYAEMIPGDWEQYDFLREFYQTNSRKLKRVNHLDRGMGIAQQGQEPVLLSPSSDGSFVNQAASQKIIRTGWAWNSKFADLDNDEWQDLFIVNGFMAKEKQESNLFYQNINGTGFENKTEELGFTNFLPTTSYTYTDFDLDGDLDVIMAPSIDDLIIYKNRQVENNSIAFTLSDELGNRSGIGAKIYIYYGNGKKQMREVVASGGFKSFDPPVTYFGLGENQKVEHLVIDWEGISRDSVRLDLEAGALYKIHRGQKDH